MDLTKESSDFKIKMDCHAKPTACLAMTTKDDSIKFYAESSDYIFLDCHDLTSQNLAMTKNNAISLKSRKTSFNLSLQKKI